jgi:hypothetical protein
MASTKETDVRDEQPVGTQRRQPKVQEPAVPLMVQRRTASKQLQDAGAQQSPTPSETCECQRSQFQGEPIKDRLLVLSHRLPSLRLVILFDD